MPQRQTSCTRFFVLLVLSIQTQDSSARAVGEYSIRVDDKATNVSTSFYVTSETSFDDLKLEPPNEYDVTISGGDGEIFFTKISNFTRRPGKIRNLHLKWISDTTADLRWEPPISRTGAIVHSYNVSLKVKELLGCKVLGRPTPPQEELLRTTVNTRVSFTGLHPYAEYEATVSAHSIIPGPPQSFNFTTKQSRIPTSKVSNLRIDDQHDIIRFDKPADCTTISGSALIVTLIIDGVSEYVRGWNENKSTPYPYYDLKPLPLVPYELYRARAYVSRSYEGQYYNPTNYQEITWRMLPAAPSAIRNLEIYEVDSNENTISIRWKPPVLAKGIIEHYNVSIGHEDKLSGMNWMVYILEGGARCKLWENYVCLEGLVIPGNATADLNIMKVHAKNKDVTESGKPTSIEFIPDSLYRTYKKAQPSQPRNLTVTLKGSRVSLKWAHPLMTYGKLKAFRIRIDVLDPNSIIEQHRFIVSMSFDCSVDMEKKEYTTEGLLIVPQTYSILVTAINQHDMSGVYAMKEIRVPQLENTSIHQLH